MGSLQPQMLQIGYRRGHPKVAKAVLQCSRTHTAGIRNLRNSDRSQDIGLHVVNRSFDVPRQRRLDDAVQLMGISMRDGFNQQFEKCV
ncbi:hypothetical protein AJ87_16855 [Rhizobium yanglingense]|nr:hypothetical protein AJ87_16855 [Rhizobium yanglingense]